MEEAQPPLANLIPYMKNAANQLFLDDPEVNTYIKYVKPEGWVRTMEHTAALLGLADFSS